MKFVNYYHDFNVYGDEAFFGEFFAGFGMVLLGVVAVILLIVLAVSAALYVLKSMGLYTIAKRRGIHNAWLSWIPVANGWILGCISDQYQYVVKGKVKNRRKILLILGLAATVLGGLLNSVQTVAVVSGSEEAAFFTGVLGMISALVGGGLAIATAVFYYIAMYDLYTSVSPQNNVLFLVLSILFQITEPFFVFLNRNKDEGMPPRRTAPAPEPAEPWENPEA